MQARTKVQAKDPSGGIHSAGSLSPLALLVTTMSRGHIRPLVNDCLRAVVLSNIKAVRQGQSWSCRPTMERHQRPTPLSKPQGGRFASQEQMYRSLRPIRRTRCPAVQSNQTPGRRRCHHAQGRLRECCISLCQRVLEWGPLFEKRFIYPQTVPSDGDPAKEQPSVIYLGSHVGVISGGSL